MAADDARSGSPRPTQMRGVPTPSSGSSAPRTTLDATEPLAPSLAGSALERVILRHTLPSGASWRSRHVVKRLLPARGWLGAATHDTHIREAQLARSGLLDALPHLLATPARALRIEGDLAAPMSADLLMDDVTPYLTAHEIGGAAGRLTGELLALLDRLARLHARFWCDPRVRGPALGLVTPRDALLLAAPATLAARLDGDDDNPYLPLALRGWEAFFLLAEPSDAATLRAVLRRPALALRAIAALPWTLTHGDVWAPNMGWLPPSGVYRTPLRVASATPLDLTPGGCTPYAPTTRHLLSPLERGTGGEILLLLDWALAAAAPATYDPLWLCGSTHALDPVAVLAAYRPRLERHLRARGVALAPPVWRALVDAGFLRTALTCGEALGRAATEAPAGMVHWRAEARARWWARRAARAAHSLTSDLQPAKAGFAAERP